MKDNNLVPIVCSGESVSDKCNSEKINHPPDELINCVDFVINTIVEDESLLNPVIAVRFLEMLYEDNLDIVDGYLNVVEMSSEVESREEGEGYLIRTNAQEGDPISSSPHRWVMCKGVIYDPFSEAVKIRQEIPSNIIIVYTKSPLIPESQSSPDVRLDDFPNTLPAMVEEKLKALVGKYHHV